MKKLTELLLAVGIGLGSLSCASSPKDITPIAEPSTNDSNNLELKIETDRFKFIPINSYVMPVHLITDYGNFSALWYNKDCKKDGDYNKKFEEYGKIIPTKELFLDLNGDGILDMSLETAIKLGKKARQKEALSKSSL